MAQILIIETSTEICSVALIRDNETVDLMETSEGQNHARLVAVYADQLLKRNELTVNDLDAIAVSKGPGSYTGLRIGVSTAKGLCYATQKPLIAVGTLEAMADHVSRNCAHYGLDETDGLLFCPMIDARRMEVFSMLLEKNGTIIDSISAEIIDESFLAELLKTRKIVFFGNGAEKCNTVIQSANAIFISGLRASAKYMNNLVYREYIAGNFVDLAYFEPYYLKDFVATVSKKNILG